LARLRAAGPAKTRYPQQSILKLNLLPTTRIKKKLDRPVLYNMDPISSSFFFIQRAHTHVETTGDVTTTRARTAVDMTELKLFLIKESSKSEKKKGFEARMP